MPTLPANLEDEVAGLTGSDPGHLDLEVGDAVAVGVAQEQTGRQAQLAGSPGEASPADEVEGLVAAGRRVGVDGLEIDPVVLGMAEALDQIVVGADPAVFNGIEVEGVPAGAADLHVAAETADEQVVAVLALEQVLAALAEKLVVAEAAVDPVGAGTAMDDVVAGEPIDRVIAAKTVDRLAEAKGL